MLDNKTSLLAYLHSCTRRKMYNHFFRGKTTAAQTGRQKHGKTKQKHGTLCGTFPSQVWVYDQGGPVC